MTYPNIAKPFDYLHWMHRQDFTDDQYHVGTIEDPTNWLYVYVPGLNPKVLKPEEIDFWRIPQSLHRNNGMAIAAGYMKWLAGYRQQDIPVVKGERYLLRATFAASIGATDVPSAIAWRFEVGGLLPALSGWNSYAAASEFGSEREHLFVVEAAETGFISVEFDARSAYPGNECDFLIHTIEVLHVESDYGGNPIKTVTPFPTQTTTTPPTTTIPPDTTTPPTTTLPPVVTVPPVTTIPPIQLPTLMLPPLEPLPDVPAWKYYNAMAMFYLDLSEAAKPQGVTNG